MADIIYNGVSASSLGVHIVSAGPTGPAGAGLEMPLRDVTVETVPGMDGEYVIDNGRWLPVEIAYQCAVQGDVAATMARVRAWLSAVGRKKLIDMRFPDEYRMARVSAPLSPATYGRMHVCTFTIVFTAQPERWLFAGDAERAVPTVAAGASLSYSLLNPTLFSCYPEVRLWLNRAKDASSPVNVTLTCGGSSVTVSGLAGAVSGSTDMNEYILIDGKRGTIAAVLSSASYSSPTGTLSAGFACEPGTLFQLSGLTAVYAGTQTDCRNLIGISVRPRWYRL